MKTDLTPKEKRWIKPLPERLINKIAAGEVIERPAAVLKELVENALDAGSDRIEIAVEKSGMKLISIVDNGCGIDPEQIEIAFSRHATSKIRDFDDLEALRSYGFRGEALPSIGAISKTRMISRAERADTGREIVIEGGVVQSIKAVAAPVGTRVEVSDLFFNTPARRKFLKSEATESRHLTRTATAMALSSINARFSYRVNGRKLFGIDDSSDNLEKRIASLLLGDRNHPLFGFYEDFDKVNITGHLSHPDKCRQNRYGLYLFINGRYIQSVTLNHAVTAGYGEMLPRGSYPVGAVFLEIDPRRVDVNVHPTKAEVRLSEEREIHDLLYQTIKRTLRGDESIRWKRDDNIDSREHSGNETRSMEESIHKVRMMSPKQEGLTPRETLDELYGGENVVSRQGEEADVPSGVSDFSFLGHDTLEATVLERTELTGLVYLGQFAGLYLLFKSGKELFVVDQHAAHERVLYEKNQEIIEKGGAVSQNLLFPINVDLPADQYALFEEAREILKSVGFEAEPFGSRTVMVSAVPTVLTRKSPEKMFTEILNDIEDLRKGGHEIKKAIAQSIACRGAVMAGDRMNEEEAMKLMGSLLQTETRYCCPHGRPIVFRISRDELDRKFGRK